MADSMIGKWFYVCNCGPSCKCAFRSEFPSECPCGEPAAKRRVLVEDEHAFYVCETGPDAQTNNSLGDAPFTCSNGRPLQAFPKAWRQTKRRFMYRGMDVNLEDRGDACTVTIEEQSFDAMKHVERGLEGWMGYPCYRMFVTAEEFARALVDDWDVIGDSKNLAPPSDANNHNSSHSDSGHNH